jgi:hypothetical protein
VVGDRDIGHTLKTEHEKSHDGDRRMCTNINTKYVTHDLQTKVKITCRDGYDVCSMWSGEPKKPVGAIISEFPLHLLMFDLTTFPYPDKDGLLYLLLVVDHCTKYSWAVPVPDKETTTIADYLYDLFTLFDVPVPMCFHCDNDGQYGRGRVTDTNRENGWYIQYIMK